MLTLLSGLLEDYEIYGLTRQNFYTVKDIYDSNLDFFMITEGEPAQLEKSVNDTELVPPGLSPDKKIFAAFSKNGKPVAILDLLEGFPDETCCWIGLLLVHRDLHGKGIGRELTSAVEKTAVSKGYNSIMLGVVTQNIKALRFWSSLGFEKIRESVIARENKPDQNITVMKKPL